jgi:stage V sporulation protein R
MLAPKYNFGAPSIAASHVHVDGSLDLLHDYKSDGRGLDPERADKVLDYIYRVWRRPIVLHTIDHDGAPLELKKHH